MERTLLIIGCLAGGVVIGGAAVAYIGFRWLDEAFRR